MTLQDLGNIGEFVAAIAVVVSLIYLAIQVRAGSRQTEENTRALNMSAILATQNNFGRLRGWYIRDPRLYELRERGLRDLEDLEPIDRLLFRDLVVEFLFTAQIAYMQCREGLMYAELWEGMRVSLGEIFSTPGGKTLFPGVREFLSADFAEEIEAAAASFVKTREAAQRGAAAFYEDGPVKPSSS